MFNLSKLMSSHKQQNYELRLFQVSSRFVSYATFSISEILYQIKLNPLNIEQWLFGSELLELLLKKIVLKLIQCFKKLVMKKNQRTHITYFIECHHEDYFDFIKRSFINFSSTVSYTACFIPFTKSLTVQIKFTEKNCLFMVENESEYKLITTPNSKVSNSKCLMND